MSSHSTPAGIAIWRTGLPALAGQLVALREPTTDDVPAVAAVLAADDATRFGADDAPEEVAAARVIEAAIRDRLAGSAFTYVVTLAATRRVVGLIQMRRVDPTFECAEWECTLTKSARGTGVFVDAARAALRFAFESVGIHRLEARVRLDSGRANGALRKLGAVHEGILRGAVRRGSSFCDQALWALLKDDWNSQSMPDQASVH
jgi:RimJ/RimL family protein N-acetyltransferase